VEEFVLLANVSITKKIDEVFPDGCPEVRRFVRVLSH